MVKSQSYFYHPFPLNNGFWSFRFYDGMGAATSIFNAYSINGDTLITTTNYKKMYLNSAYAGALRESNKIIYFLPDTSSVELVLYNFNLQVGDTIIHPYGGTQCHGDTVTVISVDTISVNSVLFPAGGYRLAIGLSSGAGWIDGIGSGNYLLFPAGEVCVSGGDKMQCMVGDSGLVFAFPSTTPCITAIPKEANYLKGIFVSPNPFHEKCTITVSNEFKNCELKLLAVMVGQQCKTSTFVQISDDKMPTLRKISITLYLEI